MAGLGLLGSALAGALGTAATGMGQSMAEDEKLQRQSDLALERQKKLDDANDEREAGKATKLAQAIKAVRDLKGDKLSTQDILDAGISSGTLSAKDYMTGATRVGTTEDKLLNLLMVQQLKNNGSLERAGVRQETDITKMLLNSKGGSGSSGSGSGTGTGGKVGDLPNSSFEKYGKAINDELESLIKLDEGLKGPKSVELAKIANQIILENPKLSAKQAVAAAMDFQSKPADQQFAIQGQDGEYTGPVGLVSRAIAGDVGRNGAALPFGATKPATDAQSEKYLKDKMGDGKAFVESLKDPEIRAAYETSYGKGAIAAVEKLYSKAGPVASNSVASATTPTGDGKSFKERQSEAMSARSAANSDPDIVDLKRQHAAALRNGKPVLANDILAKIKSIQKDKYGF